MSEITTRAVIVPADPPPPAVAEMVLAAYRAGVLDASPAQPSVVYAPTSYTLVLPESTDPAPVWPLTTAFTHPDRRRYTFAEVVFVAGRVLTAGGVLDLGLCLLTGHVSYLMALTPIGGVALTLGAAVRINHEQSR